MAPVTSPRGRLLFVVNTPWFFVLHRLPIALEARRLGYDVHVASGSERGAEDIVNAGLTFHGLPLSRNVLSPIADIKTLIALAALYRKLRPEIVHHVTWKPIILGTLSARLVRVPALVNAFAGLGSAFVESGMILHSLRRSLMLKLVGLAKGHRNSWSIFENRDDHSSLISAGAVRADTAVVMPGIGVDSSVFPLAPEQDTHIARVVFASRMLREKGVEDLVKAARILKARNAPVKIILVGDTDRGNPSCISPEELNEWVLEGIVDWTGFQDDMAVVLREANIVCLPTYYREGVPRILMEAAATGRAIVTTDSPGCRDIVLNGVNGLLVPRRDIHRLADAIELLSKDFSLRVKFGEAGRALVQEKFEAELVVRRTLDLYAEAMSRIRHQYAGAGIEQSRS